MTRPRFRWWGYAWLPGDSQHRERIPRSAGMADADWGWDAQCGECGWETGTGGAIAADVRRQIARHVSQEHWDKDTLWRQR